MEAEKQRVALVCSNYTMQSAFALMIVALNSARLGHETLIYFTFEGLKMLEPGGMEAIQYIPTGVEQRQEQVTQFNDELREWMDKKDIPYVEDMLEMAHLEGVEIMLAGDFMKQATGSNLHLVF